ncbi:universal stress protein [Streptomyces sp. H10-C2]|uniref:universal stress protein n=1 Tax=unclassified Streptomyces TaxID=2593676 RepID=UPI0024B94988|nr:MULTISPECIES: universal stress protein [unclassified Streptomyces]MDJ0344728.1 universal stress protein [Streptomyces sp. PH10-H1]MDJ0371218.1 universal stress protein [Streptomyces sp. H10-C2]
MSRTVTVGLDGSPESMTAAHWAAREALRRGMPLRVVHVWERHPTAQAPIAAAETQQHWAERIPRDATADLRRGHPGLEITADQLTGRPAAVLPVVAEEAELLVLGSRGLSGIAGFFVGSVAQATVAHAERPVVLVRPGEAAEDEHLPDANGLASNATPYRDVVLGLDPTRPCEGLVEFAFVAAAQRGATLRVIHGWKPPSVYGYCPGVLDPGLDAEFAAQEEGALTEALRPWRDKFPGVEVTAQAVIGRSAEHLVEAASGASLVVVGRRTNHSAIGTHIGPITHAVLHHCDAPVAVVPHD